MESGAAIAKQRQKPDASAYLSKRG